MVWIYTWHMAMGTRKMRERQRTCGRAAITVGLPFYNAGTTLLPAIRSVFAQTLQDWELILYDDGSTDGSLQLARSISDARVVVHSTGRNCGLVSALNRIAQLAQGQYLARMDADDLMHPARLQRQVEFLDRHAEVPVLGSGAYVIDGDGRPMGIRAQAAPDTSDYALLRRNPILHPTVAGRTSWFRANPYDPAFPRSEDHELWCRMAGPSPVGHIGEPLLFIRDASARQTGKYAATCRSDMRIYRKYGPARVGRFRTAALLAGAWAKPLVYSMAARAGLESRLLGLRNQPLSVQQAADASAALDLIANLPLHDILRDFRA